MRIKLNYIAPLLAAGAAAVAIAAAPSAAAADPQSCTQTGSESICQSPGNVQLNDAPPPVSFDPYGGEGFRWAATEAFTAAASTAVGAADTGAKPCRVRSPQHHRLLGVTWGAAGHHRPTRQPAPPGKGSGR